MEPVYILFFGYGLYHAVFVDVAGQGELHENAVYLIVGVKFGNQVENLFFGGLCRAHDCGVFEANFFSVATFPFYI